jgi:hypothetical protein
MGLTVKPTGNGEYDVDLVLLLQTQESDLRRLYELVWRRLSSNGVYEEKLQRLSRCIRINYAGDFHLDVLPARPDPERGGTYILIPDRGLIGFKRSNPKGFIAWFEARAGLRRTFERNAPEPLPPPPTDGKTTLHRVVQLMKRRRDVIFEGKPSDAPPSILLTCLAGGAYAGEESVVEAMSQILATIAARAAQDSKGFVVMNPSNPGENLAECWQADRTHYRSFVQYISSLQTELLELSTLGGDALTKRLRELFGESPVNEAYRQAGLRVQTARMDTRLGTTSRGLVVGSGLRRTNSPHTFFGDGEE